VIISIGELPAQMLEALDIMEKVWAREPFRYQGKFFKGGFPGPGDSRAIMSKSPKMIRGAAARLWK
jgi:alkanesulfonate monooxygenase SsuD/methylene tetrahydromethanopterin reductase-like flavin-dependent oxidoreductase (luciferase family)